jgi:hypothetical protein
MPVRVKEWVQTEWLHPAVTLYGKKGDFYELSGLRPTLSRDKLARSPAWSSYLAQPATIETLQGAFYDHENDRYVFIGTRVASPYDVVAFYYSSAWSASSINDLVPTATDLGGLSMRNAVYWGGELYVIKHDNTIYRGGGYTGEIGVFTSSGSAQILCPAGDRMYYVGTGGFVERLNDADNAFEAFFLSAGDMDVRFMMPFRATLLMFVRHGNGDLTIHSLSVSTAAIRHLATIRGTGDYPAVGCLFTMHHDLAYFSPGRYVDPDGVYALDIYSYNGTYVEQIAHVRTTATAANAMGFITWRGELLFYASYSASGVILTKLMVDRSATEEESFTEFSPLTADHQSTFNHLLWNLGEELVVLGQAAASEGVYHTGAGALSDGYLVTSYLDMDSPGRLKRLETLTVLVDTAATDFKVLIKYRVNDTAAWTTAVTGNNTHRVTAANLGVEFYRLQIRVDVDDDSGNDIDGAIEAVSVRYTIDN